MRFRGESTRANHNEGMIQACGVVADLDLLPVTRGGNFAPANACLDANPIGAQCQDFQGAK
jgi:hypothetical protein